MPKNHGRIVSIFSSHKDRCPSFYHSDLHAKFQPIPTGAIREIAPLGFGGKSQLSVTKPAGPLPRRLYETIWRCHARPPRSIEQRAENTVKEKQVQRISSDGVLHHRLRMNRNFFDKNIKN